MSSDKIIWYYEVLFWELYVKRNILNPLLDSTGSPWREVDIGKMWALAPLSLLHGNPSNSWRDILVKTTIIKKVNLVVVPEETFMKALSCENSSSGHHRWTKRHGNPSKGCLDVSVCDKYPRQTNTDSQRRLSAGLYLIMFLIYCFQGRRLHPSGASSSLKQMLWLEAHVKIQNAETSGGYKNFK